MVYPNSECLQFCYWMLNVSWQTLTPPRLSLITTVYNAAVAGTSVTDLEYNNFTQVTSWRYPYFNVWRSNAGNSFIESLLYFNQWTTQPSDTFKGYVNTFISAEKSIGNWQYHKAIWLYAVPTADGALINMKNPSLTKASLISTPTFTANQGYNGASATKAINLNYQPGLSDNLNQNWLEFGSYSRTNASETTVEIGAANAGPTNNNYIIPRNAGNQIKTSAGGAATLATANADSLALASVKRTNASTVTALQRGVKIVTTAAASTGLTNLPWYSLAHNNNGAIASPSTRQTALVYISEPLIDTLAFYNNVQALLTSIGCQV